MYIYIFKKILFQNFHYNYSKKVFYFVSLPLGKLNFCPEFLTKHWYGLSPSQGLRHIKYSYYSLVILVHIS